MTDFLCFNLFRPDSLISDLRQNGGEKLLLTRFIKVSQPDILDFSFSVNEQHGRRSLDADRIWDHFDNVFSLHAGIGEEFLCLTFRLREHSNEVKFAVYFLRQLFVEWKAILAEVTGSGNNQEQRIAPVGKGYTWKRDCGSGKFFLGICLGLRFRRKEVISCGNEKKYCHSDDDSDVCGAIKLFHAG
jgi:hypothetical protein